MSPRCPPLIWSPNEAKETELFELDVIRSRRNALAHSAHDFACFSPLDNLAPSEEGKLCDLSFVQLPPSRKCTLTMLPYVGPGFYHRVAVEFMLSHKTCSWQDILVSYQATAHVARASVEEALSIMQDAWTGDEQHLAKLSVNQLIGLTASERTTVFSVRSSNSREDAPGAISTRSVHWEGGSVIDHVFETKVLTNWSYRALHDQIMHTEYTRVAQLLYIIRSLKIPPRCIVAVKTDAVVLQGYATKHKKALRQIAERTFEDLPHLRAICAQVERGQTQLYDDKRCSMAQRNGDAENCFRYSVGDAVNLLQGDYRTPKMKASPPTPVEPWVWLSEEEALKARGDLFLDGCPGRESQHLLEPL